MEEFNNEGFDYIVNNNPTIVEVTAALCKNPDGSRENAIVFITESGDIILTIEELEDIIQDLKRLPV